MFTVLLCMFAGIAVGWLLRNRDCGWASKTVTVLIWALLFLLGVEGGGNRKQKACGGARFIKIQGSAEFYFPFSYRIALFVLLYLHTEGPKAGGGGLNVLRGTVGLYAAYPFGKCGTDKGSVSGGF